MPDGETLSDEVTVPGLLQSDLLAQLFTGGGTGIPACSRFMVTENPDDAALNTLQIELAAEVSGATTIYVEAILNQ